MNESLQRDNTLILGQRLPPKIAEVVSATGSGTAINLPYGLIVVAGCDLLLANEFFYHIVIT